MTLILDRQLSILEVVKAEERAYVRKRQEMSRNTKVFRAESMSVILPNGSYLEWEKRALYIPNRGHSNSGQKRAIRANTSLNMLKIET